MKRKASILTFTTLALMGTGLCLLWWNSRPNPANAATSPTAVIVKSIPISPAVLTLLSEQALSLNDRLDALHLIRSDLPTPDRLALLQALTTEKPPGLSDDDWFTLANDIIQALRRQQPATAELAPTLLSLWHNHQLDPTLRDYALQHLREWIHDQDVRTANETNPSQIKAIQQSFLNLIDSSHSDYDPTSTTLGTVLLALHEWHHSTHAHPLSTTTFEPRLIAILADPSVHRGTRATALQIASQRKLTAALPAARSVLQDSTSDMIIRLAAINFLGCNGTRNDKEFLITYQQQNSRETLLQSSLAKALQSLSTR